MKNLVKKIFFLVSLSAILTFSACNIDRNETKPVLAGNISAQLIKVTSDFFNNNPGLANQSDLIIDAGTNFFNLNTNTREFDGKKPLSIKPIYAYGIEGIAYYELWLTEDGQNVKGWILISATNKDFPIVAFSHSGIPYSKNLIDRAASKGIVSGNENKIYRFGVSYYSMENKASERIADYGQMPTWIATGVNLESSGNGDSSRGGFTADNGVEPIEGVHYKTVSGYESLKALYSENYFTPARANMAGTLNKVFRNLNVKAASRDGYIYRWVSGPQCYYTQIPAYTSSNNYGCWSGCNNNAWTNIFGWWDLHMGKSNLIPTTSTGETCTQYRNTGERMAVVDPVQMYIRAICGTYCSNGEGATSIKNVWKGYQYASAAGYGYSYSYQWCSDPGCKANIADVLTDSIANNYRPAHVGANSHAYVAYGWAQWDTNTKWTWVFCYPGWREDNADDVWISWYDINTSTRVFVY